MSSTSVARMLGFAGLLPFYGFLLGYGLLEDWPRALSKQGFVIYSLAILAFLAGTQWRPHATGRGQVARLLVSNGLVVYAVVAVLTAQVFLAACLLLLGYLALLWYERHMDGTSGWYPTLRWQLTLLVAIAHAVFAVMQIAGA